MFSIGRRCRTRRGIGPPPAGCNLESAMVVSLDPGAYTAHLSGVNGGTGVGLVEIFHLD